MNIDHLVQSLSEPSSKRALVWIVGAVVAFVFILVKEYEKAISVLTLSAGVAGAVGISTSDTQHVKNVLGVDDEAKR